MVLKVFSSMDYDGDIQRYVNERYNPISRSRFRLFLYYTLYGREGRVEFEARLRAHTMSETLC